jgi:hypothetical protein
VFDTASQLSPDYNGGYWEFYNLSNGGFYIAGIGDAVSRCVPERLRGSALR